jgi:hypothetical protein
MMALKALTIYIRWLMRCAPNLDEEMETKLNKVLLNKFYYNSTIGGIAFVVLHVRLTTFVKNFV